MGYNYAEAFVVNDVKKLDPSSAEHQLAQELTVVALITFRGDFGNQSTPTSVEISTKIQAVTVRGYDENYTVCIGLYSFKELGFSV